MEPLSGLISAGACPPHRFLKAVAGRRVGRANVGDPVIAISGISFAQDGGRADCYGVHSKGPYLVEVGAPLQALARVAPDGQGRAAPDNTGAFVVLEVYAVGDVAEVYPIKARIAGGGGGGGVAVNQVESDPTVGLYGARSSAQGGYRSGKTANNSTSDSSWYNFATIEITVLANVRVELFAPFFAHWEARTTTDSEFWISLYRGDLVYANQIFYASFPNRDSSWNRQTFVINFFDTPGAGTFTYRACVAWPGSSGTNGLSAGAFLRATALRATA